MPADTRGQQHSCQPFGAVCLALVFRNVIFTASTSRARNRGADSPLSLPQAASRRPRGPHDTPVPVHVPWPQPVLPALSGHYDPSTR